MKLQQDMRIKENISPIVQHAITRNRYCLLMQEKTTKDITVIFFIINKSFLSND